jgi:aspartyl protease family protein
MLLAAALTVGSMAPRAADELEVTLVGVFPNKALLVIGKGAPRTVPAGQTVDDVTVVSVASNEAVIEVHGQRRIIKIGQHYAALSTGNDKIILSADVGGHFFADARVNGGMLRLMVDTGASVVAIPARDANRLGVRYLSGDRINVLTANGATTAYRVKIDTIVIGGITMNNVDAVVQESGLFMPLLGMSFLARTNMQREGDTMTLTKRF